MFKKNGFHKNVSWFIKGTFESAKVLLLPQIKKQMAQKVKTGADSCCHASYGVVFAAAKLVGFTFSKRIDSRCENIRKYLALNRHGFETGM